MNQKNVGKLGELIAVNYLINKKGYKILYRNYSKPRWGEIDVIALDKDELVFVEIRTRTSRSYGGPMESVTFDKLRVLKRSIEYFLHKDGTKYQNYSMRIDVIGITMDGNTGSIIKLDHITV